MPLLRALIARGVGDSGLSWGLLFDLSPVQDYLSCGFSTPETDSDGRVESVLGVEFDTVLLP